MTQWCHFKSHPRATEYLKRGASEYHFKSPLAYLRTVRPIYHHPQRYYTQQAPPNKATENITVGHSSYKTDCSAQVTSHMLKLYNLSSVFNHKLRGKQSWVLGLPLFQNCCHMLHFQGIADRPRGSSSLEIPLPHCIMRFLQERENLYPLILN